MEKPTNQSIKKILQTSSLLQDYVNKIQDLEKLTQIIRQYLEPELAKNCTVANLVNNELILATTSATWNHKLRFLIPDLLNQLRNLPKFKGLAKVKIIQEIAPHQNKQNSKQPRQSGLSTTNAKHIIETAEHITNKNLANALLKMAKKIK
jgi:hypothetical protein